MLRLSGADLGNSVAAVLRNTGDVNGSAFITDPKTGDAIRLAGVTAAKLKAHPADISLGESAPNYDGEPDGAGPARLLPTFGRTGSEAPVARL